MVVGEPEQRRALSAHQVEQVERLVRTTPVAWMLSLLGAALCHQAYSSSATPALDVWLAVFVLVSAARVLAALVVVHRTRVVLDRPAFERGWLAGTWLHAGLWGLLPVVLLQPGRPEAESILHITLVAIAMGGAVRLPAFERSLQAHVVLVLAPLVARDFAHGSGQQAVMALLVCLIGAYALISGRNQSHALREIEVQRRRNADLVVALQRENRRSEAALQAAERASDARSRLFAAANHDLRQPLHAMGLLLETLPPRGEAVPSREVVQHIAHCVEGMTEVVDGLLEITRLDGGQLTPQWTVVDAADAIRDGVRPYEAAARAKGLALEVRVASVPVRTDRALLLRVLANLVGNAIRYTPAGAVTIVASAVGDELQVRVHDTGIGIAEEHQSRIFDEFFQVANPSRDRRLGLGLGLATVKRLSDLLDLRIAVSSGPGRGSVFSFTLPIVEAPVEAEEATRTRGESLLAVRRVLVVEDDEDARSALVGLLASWGCDVRGAEGEDAALACLVGGFEPEAAVVDLRLGGPATGLDVVCALRARLGERFAAVLVTGDADMADSIRARGAPVPVMVKPVRAVQLRAFLSQSFSSTV
ncbi:MAG: hybrid sensor histidine kinase/response regulator [Ideonella sp.]|nr:hybrid sensor histidine kinase/response regulator [Ideonella sp.]